MRVGTALCHNRAHFEFDDTCRLTDPGVGDFHKLSSLASIRHWQRLHVVQDVKHRIQVFEDVFVERDISIFGTARAHTRHTCVVALAAFTAAAASPTAGCLCGGGCHWGAAAAAASTALLAILTAAAVLACATSSRGACLWGGACCLYGGGRLPHRRLPLRRRPLRRGGGRRLHRAACHSDCGGGSCLCHFEQRGLSVGATRAWVAAEASSSPLAPLAPG